MFKKNIKINLISFLLLAILSVNRVYAFNCNAGTTSEIFDQMNKAGTKAWLIAPGSSGATSMTGIIQYAISAFLGLLGIIFLILIIYSGFNWMTAQGDEEKVTLAKNTLTRAIIGLVIIILAYAITYFVFSSLPGGEGGTGGPGFTSG